MFRGEDPKEHLTPLTLDDLQKLIRLSIDTFALTKIRISEVNLPQKGQFKVVGNFFKVVNDCKLRCKSFFSVIDAQRLECLPECLPA
jgi:hypothetical protein